MDLKGGSWVGGMYQRFEAMCAEVEEAVCEDAVKYVENQVRTVGETVKKFYSDVMLDLHSPSPLDTVKADDSLSTVVHHSDVKICRNGKVDDKTKPVDAASCNSFEDFDGTATCDDGINHGSSCSAICNVIKPFEPTSICAGEKYTKVNSKSHGTELALLNHSTSVAKDLDCRSDSQNMCHFNSASINATVTDKSDEEVTFVAPRNESDESSSILFDASSKEASEVSDSEDVGISREMKEVYEGGNVVKVKKTRVPSGGHLSTDLDISLMKTESNAAITCNKKISVEVDEGLLILDIETSSPFITCDFKRCDADKQEVLVRKQFNEVKLEESCVLVEKNDNSSKSALEHVQKSYKKKIQDVFSPRRWTKSKQGQEQFAVWYEEQSGKKFLSTPIMQAEIQKSQNSECFESDWELL